MNWWNMHTDLLDETYDGLRIISKSEKEEVQSIEGFSMENFKEGRVLISRMEVQEAAVNKIGKEVGVYITVTVPTLSTEDDDGFEQIQQVILKEWNSLLSQLQLNHVKKILCIGLGNRHITPDAIGPRTIETLQEQYLSSSLEKKEVYLYAPGVTGQTGLETSEFVSALAKKLQVEIIVVIDALAARSHERLCRTIQLSSGGIHPGSGVGNKRQEISKKTMGVPVIAIGIPTVVDAPVIINESIENVVNAFQTAYEQKNAPSTKLGGSNFQKVVIEKRNNELITPIFGKWMEWSMEERGDLLRELLPIQDKQLFVSPKEMDSWLKRYEQTLSNMIQDWLKTS